MLSSLVSIYQLNSNSSFSIYLIIILSLVSVLQLVISKQLVLRFITLPLKTHIPNEMIKFLIFAGPLSAFVTSTIVMISRWVWLKIPTEVLYYIWAAKWVGDFIGIIFLTPVILFFRKNVYVRRAKHQTAAILTTLSVLGAISWIYILSSYNKQLEKSSNLLI